MQEPPIRKNLEDIPEYIPGRRIEEVKKEFNLTEVIKLASNENPLGPSPKALKAIEGHSKDIFYYPDANIGELRQALAVKFKVKPENVFVGNGSDEIMLLTGLAFLSAGEEVIISRNTFGMYELVAKLLDGKIKFVELNDGAYDLTEIAAQITPKTKLIFICNPNNPTGKIVTQAAVDAFLSKVPEDVIVYFDEAYADYVEAQDFPALLPSAIERKNVIVSRTFSKIYGLAGLRVGYCFAHPRLIKYLMMVKLPFNVNKLGQIAGLAALDDQEHYDKSRQTNMAGKRFLYSELVKLDLPFAPTEANFILVDLEKNADLPFIELMRLGVIVRPLRSFGLPNCIRVSIGTPEQNERFIAALKQVLHG